MVVAEVKFLDYLWISLTHEVDSVCRKSQQLHGAHVGGKMGFNPSKRHSFSPGA